MKHLVPLLAVVCFSIAGLGCKSTCCGECGTCESEPAAHNHSHDGDGTTCCGADGKCCK